MLREGGGHDHPAHCSNKKKEPFFKCILAFSGLETGISPVQHGIIELTFGAGNQLHHGQSLLPLTPDNLKFY